jgi:thioredoxin reductase (NADPH)
MAQSADIAIIGTGPAGISAAITSAVRNKSVLLFGDISDSSKLARAHQINNYPGFYAKSGAEIQAAFKSHLDSLGISVLPSKVTNIYPMGKSFTILAGQDQYEAKAVIIATGVSFGKPVPGEETYLGRGVSYCATCDGMLYKKKIVAVLAYSKSEEKEASFLADLAAKVYYIPMYKEKVEVDTRCEVILGTPSAITGEKFVNTLELEQKSLDVNGVFILRESISPAQLVEGVTMDGNHIAVDRQMKTSIPGLFAAGDITGTPYQYIKAAGEGNVAALSAVSYIA